MYEQIAAFLAQQEYDLALQAVDSQKQVSGYTDTLAILEAEIYYGQKNFPAMFLSVKNGLLYNDKQFELYFMLGKYYLSFNPFQAYLCFEQAEFYCDDSADLAVIRQAKQKLLDAGYSVPGVSVVILSYNAKEDMKLCLNSLKETVSEAFCEIIVIDNASTDGVTDYLKQQTGIKLVCNDKNLGFPAGCNLGIKISQPYHDILLLNNDTVVPDNAIFWLRMGLYETPSVGATGSVSNHVSNNQQVSKELSSLEECLQFARTNNLPTESPYEKRLRLIGFAMLLKRTALDAIGLLDERFSPGNFEDDDLSIRLIQAGYQILLCKNSFIYHYGGRNFGKDSQKFVDLCNTNMAKFFLKWGFDLHYYSDEQKDLLDLMHKTGPSGAFRVLEVGCGMGNTLNQIANRYPDASIYGIEPNAAIIPFAKNFIPHITNCTFESLKLPYPKEYFDYIICVDSFGQMRDPQKTLKQLCQYLKPDGIFLSRIANLMYYPIILNLLQGKFTYRYTDFLNPEQIRFFTLQEIETLFERCGLHIDSGFYSIPPDLTLSENDRRLYDALREIPEIADLTQFKTQYYLFSATKA